MRIDQERLETDPIIDPGRCVYVYVQSEIGWLTISRCISEEMSKIAHTGQSWRERSTGHNGIDLGMAALEGLKRQLQDYGFVEQRFVRAVNDGTQLANVVRNSR